MKTDGTDYLDIKYNEQEKPKTGFPYQLAEDHVLSWSRKGDIVLDPLSGSGTTALAAVRNERSFIGIEASEVYVQQSLLRVDEWQDKNLT